MFPKKTCPRQPAQTGVLKNGNSAPTTYLTARSYYDKEYSPIQVNKQNHLSGLDIISNAYDFANRLTKTRRDHTATPPGGTLKTYTVREEYVYDDASRLRFTRHKINANNWVVTSAPVYDELNRLADKRLHASNYDGTSAVTLASNFNYLQSLDYTYNIRGWLTGVNDVANCNAQSGDQLADMFSLQLSYDSPVGGGTAQHNGNISTMQWNTYINSVCGTRQLYRFSYDGANRLTIADHRTWSGSAWTDPARYNESNITYDLNGNIKTYNRRGLVSGTSTFGTIDNLTYYFDDVARPDRLTRVVDAASATKGFKYNTVATSPHYTYDLNGNLTNDKHKDLFFNYNHFNLPNSINNSADAYITLTYTADGEKLTKVAGGQTRNYVTGIEYLGANLEAIYHGEGRCTPNGASAFHYEYTIKDHLGNARVNFRANGAAVTFLEEMHYYPFGMLMEGIGTAAVTVNKYKYNGKELNDDLGLNWSDYGARWYDAAVGRFPNVDPIINKFPYLTPYNYASNSPVAMIDLWGLQGIKPSEAGELLYGNDQKGFITTATPELRDGSPLIAGFVDLSYAIAKFTGIDAIDNAIATALDPNSSTEDIVTSVADATIANTRMGSKGETSSSTSTKSLSAPTSSRKGALNEAKRDAGIPRTQHPEVNPDTKKQYTKMPMTDSNGKQILGKDGKPILTREYTYTTKNGEKVVIQDHSAGHKYSDGKGTQGAHFNVRPIGDTRNGKVDGTKEHYPFDPFNN